ncbi:DUF3300 domain-containing protein [Paraburkholderia sp. CNPSo 3281]|uniref:DUF3300 domain-containing protein n=1 Tax=Paraburkholderia sp. CNPSo 3281 TaxID=2940933 RepID=UPI0020B791CB|nr:DUF3300 domain-containing protein [Paraburkholderia sp. CNPSo 3281]MCP3720738.1 DUF3300 domain-containing protein [Paraburkholderia sp. CNPSo 3281]
MNNWKTRGVRALFFWLVLLATISACADHGSAGLPPSGPPTLSTAPSAPPLSATAPSAAESSGPAPFKPEEIDALVAPIALYPDSLLAQVLMASTYPLEIVHAARWVKANANVKGDAAVKAVQNEPWDTSVKSLVAFPQILEPMNDRIDWTQKLGDAFLAQQKDVFDAVQRLRARAQESGNLKSNEQQNVIVEQAPAGSGQTIVKIEPANPQVIYVPAYDPAVVYGGWGYPAYPPYYWPPYPAYYPGYYPGAGLAFGVGLLAAGAIFADCNSCWGGDDINIDSDRARNVDRNFDSSKLKNGERGGRWQHDAGHREGVAYRDNATRDKFAGSPGADRRSQYRGRGAEAGNRMATGADRGGAGNRASVGDRGGVADRSSPGNMNRVGNGSRGSYGGGYGGGRDGAFSGVGGSGSASQRNFDRGSRSMQGSGFNRPAGGGMRGGGGRGGRR